MAEKAAERMGAQLSQCQGLAEAQQVLEAGVKAAVQEAQREVLVRVGQKLQETAKEAKVLKTGIRKMNDMIGSYKLELASAAAQVGQLQQQLLQAKGFNDSLHA